MAAATKAMTKKTASPTLLCDSQLLSNLKNSSPKALRTYVRKAFLCLFNSSSMVMSYLKYFIYIDLYIIIYNF